MSFYSYTNQTYNILKKNRFVLLIYTIQTCFFYKSNSLENNFFMIQNINSLLRRSHFTQISALQVIIDII